MSMRPEVRGPSTKVAKWIQWNSSIEPDAFLLPHTSAWIVRGSGNRIKKWS